MKSSECKTFKDAKSFRKLSGIILWELQLYALLYCKCYFDWYLLVTFHSIPGMGSPGMGSFSPTAYFTIIRGY